VLWTRKIEDMTLRRFTVGTLRGVKAVQTRKNINDN
jgi:hypothetical protein